MILRIVLGLLAPGTDPAAVADLHESLVRTARDIAGLESLIFGTRRPLGGPPEAPVEAAVITVWRDPESMVRATGVNEQDRFLGTRLGFRSRWSAPTITRSSAGRSRRCRRPRRRTSGSSGSARDRTRNSALMDTLRAQQPRLVELGLVASHLGRRVVGSDVEAVSVGVWPDRAAIRRRPRAALKGRSSRTSSRPGPSGSPSTRYDGVEIAPRLPVASGPSIFIIDDDLQIVDLTSSAAAALGSPAEDLLGRSLHELSMTESAELAGRRARLMEEGTISGEATWVVPEAGRVFIRFVGRRDVPIPGRHAVLVRRVSEPMPTLADLETAIREAFPGVEVSPA